MRDAADQGDCESGGFVALRTGMVLIGDRSVTFRDFDYMALD